MNNRLRQVYKSIFDKYKKEDEEFVLEILNKDEFKLFNKLKDYQKKHSIRVLLCSVNLYKFKDEKLKKYDEIKEVILKESFLFKLSRTCLLHDIGKSEANISVIDACIFVIAKKIFKNNLKNKKMEVLNNHAEIGYNILKDMNLSAQELEAIKNHHTYEFHSDIKDVLSAADEYN